MPAWKLTTVLAALLFSQAAAAPASAATKQGSLLTIELRDPGALTAALGAITSRLDRSYNAAWFHATLARWLAAPGLAGVDLSAAIRIDCLNPRKYADPWVFQLRVADAKALEHAMKGRQRPLVVGDRAFLCRDAAAIRDLRSWQKRRPGGRPTRRGQVYVRADVRQVLKVFSKEIARAVADMGTRMEQAVKRGRPLPDSRREAGGARAQLQLALLVARQIKEVEAGLDLSPRTALLLVKAKPVPGGILAKFAAAHPSGGLRLLSRCPADAALVALHNLAATQTLARSAMRLLGLPAAQALPSPASPPGGQAMAAVFLTGRRGAPFEFLFAADGLGARDFARWWDNMAAGGRESRAFPFRITPLPVPNSAREWLRVAKLTPNKAVLGAQGASTALSLLGRNVLAEMKLAPRLCLLAVGATPWRHLRTTTSSGRRDAPPITSGPAFRGAFSRLSQRPNALLYVSPAAILGWLALGGLKPVPRQGESGLAAALTLTKEGEFQAGLSFPLDTFLDALRRRPASAKR